MPENTTITEVTITTVTGDEWVYNLRRGSRMQFWKWDDSTVHRFILGDGESIHEIPACNIQSVSFRELDGEE